MSIRNDFDEAERAGMAAMERVEMLMGSSEKSHDSSLSYAGSTDKKFRISIRYWNGTSRDMTVHPNMTVFSLKKLCCKEAPLATVLPHQLELSSNGRLLNDSWTLSECSISRGSAIGVSFPGHHSHRGDRPARMGHRGELAFGAFMPSPLPPRHDEHSVEVDDSFVGSAAATPLSVQSRGEVGRGGMSGFGGFDRTVDESGALMTSAATYQRLPLKSEECTFHALIEGVMDEVGDRVVGVPLEDEVAQAALADLYAQDAAQRHVEALQQLRRVMDTSAQGLAASRREASEQLLRREAEECRAERDLWSLFAVYMRNDLLRDVNDEENKQSLSATLDSLDPSDSIRCVVNKCLSADQRIMKARVVRDWLEGAAEDLVHEPPVNPASVVPWRQTVDRMLTGRGAVGQSRNDLLVQGAHPDAQLSRQGLVKPLDGMDNVDQESVMKVVWQCIRSGQLHRAQEIAHQHKWYWLTACLMGVQHEYYQGAREGGEQAEGSGLFAGDDDEVKDAEIRTWGGSGVSRRGNPNRAVWLQTCWKYSNLLDGNPSNKKTVQASGRGVSHQPGGGPSGGNHVGVLEAAVYARLSYNLSPLLSSRLVSTWTDTLWAVVTCAHERQLAGVIAKFHDRRANYSRLIPGTTKAVRAAEKQFLKHTEDLDSTFDNSCDKLFRQVDKPLSASGSEVADVILQLQVAVISGTSALEEFIQTQILPYAISTLEAADSTIHDISPPDLNGISLSSPAHSLRSQQRSTAASGRASSADSSFSNEKSRVLRIFAHVVLWLRFSCPHREALKSLANNKVIYVVVEAYIEQLIHRRQYSLVALYAAFLSRPRRVDKYAAMMRRISPSSTRQAVSIAREGDYLRDGSGVLSTSMALSVNDDTATAVEVLQLAHRFFREEEVLEITKEVVGGARRGKRGWFDYDDMDDTNVSIQSVANTPASTLKRSGMYSVSLAQQTPLSRGIPQTPSSAWSKHSQDSPSMSRTRGTAATPFRGDLSMTLGQADSARPGDMVDSSRLESLRWLCYRPDQRVAAVCEANAFLRALMLESHGSKTAQVHSLLWDILPRQVLEEGDVQQASRTDSLSNRPAQAAAEEESWGAEVCQLHFWQGFDASVGRFERWNGEVGEVYEVLPSMLGDASLIGQSLGRYKFTIHRAAEDAATCIVDALTCGHQSADVAGAHDASVADPHPLQDLFATGYQEVWLRAVSAAYGGLIGRFASREVSDTDDDLTPRESIDALWKEIQDMVHEITSAAALFPQGSVGSVASLSGLERGGDGVDSALCCLYGSPSQLQAILAALEQIRNKFGATRLTYDALVKSSEVLASIIEIRKVMRLVAFVLLNSYIKVCTQTGDIMETLGDADRALYWYRLAVGVADLIADDEKPSMQLYRALYSADLKLLLAGVHHAAMHVLRLGKGAGFRMI